jgi:hypothetical protein
MGTHTKVVFFFSSTPSQKEQKKRTPISCTSYTQNSRGIIFFSLSGCCACCCWPGLIDWLPLPSFLL